MPPKKNHRGNKPKRSKVKGGGPSGPTINGRRCEELLEKQTHLQTEIGKGLMDAMESSDLMAEIKDRAMEELLVTEPKHGQEEEGSYGDGDQSPLSGRDGDLMTSFWGQGADYSPLHSPSMSQWSHDCYIGDPAKIQAHLEKHGKNLLDKRDSQLRMACISHVIAGARSSNPKIPWYFRVKVTPSTNFQESMRILIRAGARVNAKDVAGYTPIHHCTSALGNDLTLELAKILIEAGANVNLPNRMGVTPIYEPTMAMNQKFVKFLLDHGADAGVKDNNGITYMKIALSQPKIMKLISEASAKHSEQEKQKLVLEGKYKVCAACKNEGASRCSGCIAIWYCGKECQRKDWTRHKKECRESRARFYVAKFQNVGVPHTSYNWKAESATANFNNPLSEDCGPNFIVKVQIPIDRSQTLMFVYNKDRSCQGYLGMDQPIYKLLHDKLTKEGMLGGIKGYFLAFKGKSDELFINPHEIQPPEKW